MGRMGGGRGRGYRNMYYMTGLPAWARGGYPAYGPGVAPGYAPGFAPGYMPGYQPSAEEEKLFLANQAEALEKQLQELRERLESLEKEGKE